MWKSERRGGKYSRGDDDNDNDNDNDGDNDNDDDNDDDDYDDDDDDEDPIEFHPLLPRNSLNQPLTCLLYTSPSPRDS